MQRAFKSKAVAINEISDHKVTLEEAKHAFKKGLENGLNVELTPFELSKEQLDYVNDLAKNRYESDEWNFKR